MQRNDEDDPADSVNLQRMELSPKTETELLEGFFHIFVEEGMCEDLDE